MISFPIIFCENCIWASESFTHKWWIILLFSRCCNARRILWKSFLNPYVVILMKLLFTFGWALKKWCGLNSVQKKKKKRRMYLSAHLRANFTNQHDWKYTDISQFIRNNCGSLWIKLPNIIYIGFWKTSVS